jgi:phosphopantetheinyl transferase
MMENPKFAHPRTPMPLFYQQDINPGATMALWRIEEDEDFFQVRLPVRSDIRSPQKRLQHLAGRHLLQVLEPGFRYGSLRVAASGRPYLEDGSIDFSLSHTEGVAAAAMTRTGRAGIDVEHATPRIERIMPRFLHPEELAWVRRQDPPSFAAGLPDAAPWVLPTLLWSAKETVYKWQGAKGVEFHEEIRFDPFDLQPSGSIDFRFLRGVDIRLELGYQVMGGLCVTWLTASCEGLPDNASLE